MAVIVALPLDNMSEISKMTSCSYSETQQESGFADTTVANQDELE
jgi:hypothetical protein